MENIPRPDSVTERKIGGTTYIVSSYGEKISRTVIKNKLLRLIEARAAEEFSEKDNRKDQNYG